MANPQLEDGFTRISNELLLALIGIRLPSRHKDVLLCIMRMTYGYNLKVNDIPNRQIVRMVGIGKTHVSKILKDLAYLQIIVRDGYQIGIQKDWEQWKPLDKLPCKVTKVTTDSNGELPSKVTKVTAESNMGLPYKVTKVTTESNEIDENLVDGVTVEGNKSYRAREQGVTVEGNRGLPCKVTDLHLYKEKDKEKDKEKRQRDNSSFSDFSFNEKTTDEKFHENVDENSITHFLSKTSETDTPTTELPDYDFETKIDIPAPIRGDYFDLNAYANLLAPHYPDVDGFEILQKCKAWLRENCHRAAEPKVELVRFFKHFSEKKLQKSGFQ